MKKVLLIVPPLIYHGIDVVMRITHLGIGYIAAVLEENGFEVDGLNLFSGIESLDNFINLLKEKKPKIVGFSTMTETHNNGLRLAEIVKTVLPDSIIVFGGPHVTFMDKETLKNPNVDIVVRNEGEYTMLELANNIIKDQGKISEIKGITYRNGNKIVRNSNREFIKDLDILPFPKRFSNKGNFDIKNNSCDPSIIILSGRGCPSHCKFCAASAMSGGHRRVRSVENVIAEIKSIINKNISSFVAFSDDTLTEDTTRLFKLCDFLKSENISWGTESRVDAITDNIAQIMAESGCKSLQFGVENASANVLQIMNKGISLPQIEKAISSVQKYGIKIYCSLMIGYPGETEDSCRQTIEYAVSLKEKYGIQPFIAITQLYPGTYIFNNASKLGITIRLTNYDDYTPVIPNFDTSKLSIEQIRNIHFDARAKLMGRPFPVRKIDFYHPNHNTFDDVKELFYSFEQCSEKKLIKLADLLEQINLDCNNDLDFKSCDCLIKDVLDLNFVQFSDWFSLSVSFFLTLIWYKTGKIDRAIKALILFMKTTNNTKDEYYNTVLAFIKLKLKRKSNKEIKKELDNKGFDEETIDEIINDLLNTNNLFGVVEMPKCPDCEQCGLLNECLSKKDKTA